MSGQTYRFNNFPITFGDIPEPGCPASDCISIYPEGFDPVAAIEIERRDRHYIERHKHSCQIGARNRARYLKEREESATVITIEAER